MSENDGLHGLLLDKRIVERNMLRGLIAKEVYQKHLSDLEDCAEFGVESEVQFVSKSVEDEEASDDAPANS